MTFQERQHTGRDGLVDLEWMRRVRVVLASACLRIAIDTRTFCRPNADDLPHADKLQRRSRSCKNER